VIRNGRRVLALGSIVVLTAMAGTATAYAKPAPPTPIPRGEYVYRGSFCYAFSWPRALYSEGGCFGRPSKLTVHAPTGSVQRSTGRDNCRDYIREETVDYQTDGIHLLRTYMDGGDRLGTNDPDCGRIVSIPQVCNPIPAPLILPTGAKPGQHLTYTMVCAPFVVHQVSIDIVGTKEVMIGGKWLTTLIIRTSEEVINHLGGFKSTQEAWVIPRNGLVVFSKVRIVAHNYLVVMTETLNFRSVLSTCSTCPDPVPSPGDR
jgi:hypothetical protein